MSHGRKQNMMTHVTWQKAEQDDTCHMVESKPRRHMSHGRKQNKITCHMAETTEKAKQHVT